MVHFPVPPSIDTERLTIRCPQLDDVTAIYEAVRESLPELLPWMPWAMPDYSLADCEENTRRAIAKFITREDLRYHFHDKRSGRLLVCSGLHCIDWSVPKFEIGYWCRSSEAGKGYVTEGVRALTRLAFGQLGATRVEIRCDDKNKRSLAVAERCGFGLEGILHFDNRDQQGTLRDTRIYALTSLDELR